MKKLTKELENRKMLRKIAQVPSKVGRYKKEKNIKYFLKGE